MEENNKNFKNDSPKVLVVSHMYPKDDSPTSGIFVHEQVKFLRKLGLDVRVFSGYGVCVSPLRFKSLKIAFRQWCNSNKKINWELYDTVPVIRFHYLAISRLSFYWQGPSYNLSAFRFYKAIKELFDFDIIHAHTSFLDGGLAKVLSKKKKFHI